MKKLILIILLIASCSYGQGITTQNSGVNTSQSYTWTVPQYFSQLIANILTVNNVDSASSLYLYRPNGTLFAFIDATKDSAFFDGNVYIKGLGTQTVIASDRVTTNKLYSDTIIGNSPIFLLADSVIAQNKLFAPYIAMNTAGNFISRLAIGMTDSTGAFNIVRTDKNVNRSTLSQATDTSSFNFRFTPTGNTLFSIKDNSGISRFYADSTGFGTLSATSTAYVKIYTGQSYNTNNSGKIVIGEDSNGQTLTLKGGDGAGADRTQIVGTRQLDLSGAPIRILSGSTLISTFGASGITNTVPTLAPNGSSTAPSYSFSGKTNKGMYLIDTGNVGINGNLTVNGNLTSTNFAYGSVYIADDYPDTITVTSSSDYYTVGAKQGANGKAWTSGGVLKNVTVQDSSMTVLVAGKYEVSYSFSFKTITGVNNGRFNWYLFVNDVKQEKTGAKRLMSGTNDLGVGAIAPTVLDLAANDVIKLKVLSPDDSSNQIAFEYCVIHVKKIDN